MPDITRLGPDAPIAETLMAEGAVIVENVMPAELIDAVLHDLRGPFDEQGLKFTNEFNGFKTRRLGGILALSRTAADILAHPLVLGVAD